MFSQAFLQDPLNFLSMWQVVRRMFFCKMRAFLVLACCGIGFATSEQRVPSANCGMTYFPCCSNQKSINDRGAVQNRRTTGIMLEWCQSAIGMIPQ